MDTKESKNLGQAQPGIGPTTPRLPAEYGPAGATGRRQTGETVHIALDEFDEVQDFAQESGASLIVIFQESDSAGNVRLLELQQPGSERFTERKVPKHELLGEMGRMIYK